MSHSFGTSNIIHMAAALTMASDENPALTSYFYGSFFMYNTHTTLHTLVREMKRKRDVITAPLTNMRNMFVRLSRKNATATAHEREQSAVTCLVMILTSME